MGTNYYWRDNVCAHCKRGDAAKHIGKSSGGWCFSLHVYPEEGIHNLNQWEKLWGKPGSKIEDEYGWSVEPLEMRSIVTVRDGKPRKENEVPYGAQSWEEFYERNLAEPGPNHLLRHKVDMKYCIGHGEGTWDHLIGYFS